MESAIIFRLNNSECNFRNESGTERGLEKQFSDDSNQTRRTKSDSFAKFNLPFDRKSFERVQRWRLWAKTSGGRNRVARWRIEI
jgi:hypothetical protein